MAKLSISNFNRNILPQYLKLAKRNKKEPIIERIAKMANVVMPERLT